MEKDPFKEYLRESEPDKAHKGYAWSTAIGLQAVDGLKPSKYLIDTAIQNIEGKITMKEAQSLIDSYYEERPVHLSDDERTEEADKVSSRIAEILSETAFTFSPNEYIAIHRKLFQGIYKHAGKIRDYNITKKEWVLDGATVMYGSASELRATLEYDFSQEKDVILDELGSFATEQLLPICAQARSYGYQLIVASQSIADLEAVSDTFTERLMENCGQYCVLQLNSAKDAEFMSNLFGTFVTTETTYVSLDQRLGDGVKGTKRLVHEYRISPDEIKGIPPLTAFFYDKRRPDVVYKVKVPFTGG